MYAVGFIAIMVFTLVIFVAGFVFVSLDSGKTMLDKGPGNTRPESYVSIRNLDTNTIETVDTSGVTRHWRSNRD